jgi:hypothetical protein
MPIKFCFLVIDGIFSKKKTLSSHNLEKSQPNNKPTRYCSSPQVKAVLYTMAHLQSFMSDFLGECDCSSIYVVSDNARIPQQILHLQQQQQQQQQQPLSGPAVSTQHHSDYKGTTRWDSGSYFSSPGSSSSTEKR